MFKLKFKHVNIILFFITPSTLSVEYLRLAASVQILVQSCLW